MATEIEKLVFGIEADTKQFAQRLKDIDGAIMSLYRKFVALDFSPKSKKPNELRQYLDNIKKQVADADAAFKDYVRELKKASAEDAAFTAKVEERAARRLARSKTKYKIEEHMARAAAAQARSNATQQIELDRQATAAKLNADRTQMSSDKLKTNSLINNLRMLREQARNAYATIGVEIGQERLNKAGFATKGAQARAATAGVGTRIAEERLLGVGIDNNTRLYRAQRGAIEVGTAALRNRKAALDAETAELRKQQALMRQQTRAGMRSVGSVGGSRNPFGQVWADMAVTYGSGSAISSTLQNVAKLESMKLSLQAIYGSAAAAADVMKQYEQVSNETGLSIIANTQEFLQLAGAAHQSGVSVQQVMKMYKGLGMAARAYGMSQEQVKLSVVAFTQMISKTKVTSEELVRQLGDHIPGILTQAAAAMKMSVPKLLDEMKRGNTKAIELLDKLTSDWISKFNKTLDLSLSSLRARFNLFQNAWTKFQEAIGEGGLTAGANIVMKQLVEGLSDPRSLQAARELGNLLRYVSEKAAGALKILFNNIEAVNGALVTLSTVAFLGLTKRIAVLLGPLGLLTTAVAALVGKYYAEWKNKTVELFGSTATLSEHLSAIGTYVSGKFTAAWNAISQKFEHMGGFLSGAFSKAFSDLKPVLASLGNAAALVFRGMYNGLTEVAKILVRVSGLITEAVVRLDDFLGGNTLARLGTIAEMGSGAAVSGAGMLGRTASALFWKGVGNEDQYNRQISMFNENAANLDKTLERGNVALQEIATRPTMSLDDKLEIVKKAQEEAFKVLDASQDAVREMTDKPFGFNDEGVTGGTLPNGRSGGFVPGMPVDKLPLGRKPVTADDWKKHTAALKLGLDRMPVTAEEWKDFAAVMQGKPVPGSYAAAVDDAKRTARDKDRRESARRAHASRGGGGVGPTMPTPLSPIAAGESGAFGEGGGNAKSQAQEYAKEVANLKTLLAGLQQENALVTQGEQAQIAAKQAAELREKLAQIKDTYGSLDTTEAQNLITQIASQENANAASKFVTNLQDQARAAEDLASATEKGEAALFAYNVQLAQQNALKEADAYLSNEQVAATAKAAADKIFAERRQQIAQENNALRDNISQIEEETRLIGVLPEVRTRELALVEAKNRAKKLGLDLDSQEFAQTKELLMLMAERQIAQDKLNEQTQRQQEFVQAIGESLTTAIGDAVYGAKDLGEAFRDVGLEISKLGLDYFLVQPVKKLLSESTAMAPGQAAGGGLFSGLFSGIGDFFGNIFGGFRANGGPVSPMTPYVVGERGPELFVPSSGGRIVPNHRLQAANNNVNVTVNISTPNPASFRDSRGQLYTGLTRAVQQGMRNT